MPILPTWFGSQRKAAARKPRTSWLATKLVRHHASVLMLVAALTFVTTAPAVGQQKVLQLDDLFEIKSVGSPALSANGRWVAYTLTETDTEEDSSETSIWVVDATDEDAKPRRFSAPGSSASSPRFSPDSGQLAFLASRGEDAKTQVWSFDLRGGDAQPLTEVEQGVSSFSWAPDGSRLLLVITDPDPKEALPDDAPAKKRPAPHVIDRLQFKRDYAGYLDRRRSHLYVYDLDDAVADEERLRQITSGDFDDGSPAWSPDGTRIAFVSNRTAEPDGNDNSDIWVVSADNTDKGRTLLQITDNPGSDGSPVWTPDGRSIVHTSNLQPEQIWYDLSVLSISSARGGETRTLTEDLDRNVYSPRILDEDTVQFLIEDSGEVHLGQMKISGAGGKIERPISGAQSLRSISATHAGRTALLVSRPQRPWDVFVFEDGGLRELTQTNDRLLAERRLGRTENIHFQSTDGTEIEGWVTFPPDFQEGLRYPTLLRIHGGPVSQYDFGFSFEAQWFAAQGYVVVRSNPRGSSGYGFEFSRALFADWGNLDTQDVIAAVDHTIERGWSDADRLGVGGWSYGGILTNYVITQSERFEAAVTGASEVLYISNYGHDHYQLQWEKELGLPWESREVWEKLSPFNRVQHVTTPTLIMGGALDWNVPILNSEQLYQALKRLGVTTELIVYPGEHHGIRRPSFRRDRYERQLEWYDRYVKGEPMALEEESTGGDD